jgi:tetratricopeptide (TPR) repeat protein
MPFPGAKEALSRALELDPCLGEAFGHRANISLMHDRNCDQAFKDWQLALELDPSLSEIRTFYAGYGLCLSRGDDDAAVIEADRAVADDPLNFVPASFREVTLAIVGRADAAIEGGLRAVALHSSALLPRFCLAMVYGFLGDVDKAIDAAQGALMISGRSTNVLAIMSGLSRSNTASFPSGVPGREDRSHPQCVQPARATTVTQARDDVRCLRGDCASQNGPPPAMRRRAVKSFNYRVLHHVGTAGFEPATP